MGNSTPLRSVEYPMVRIARIIGLFAGEKAAARRGEEFTGFLERTLRDRFCEALPAFFGSSQSNSRLFAEVLYFPIECMS